MNMTHEWVRVAIAAIGGLSLLLGYRSFCGEKTVRAARITSLLSGSMLAIFGIAILVADVHAAHRPQVSTAHPTWEKKSLVAPKPLHPRMTSDRLI